MHTDLFTVVTLLSCTMTNKTPTGLIFVRCCETAEFHLPYHIYFRCDLPISINNPYAFDMLLVHQHKKSMRNVWLPRRNFLRGTFPTNSVTGLPYIHWYSHPATVLHLSQRFNVTSWSYTTQIVAPIVPMEWFFGFSNEP